MHHQEQDARSLALHTAAIELMRADETLIQRALDILARWDTHVSVSSKPLRDEWVRILRERDWELALSVGERGNQLRQASPVSCVLPNERRWKIIHGGVGSLEPAFLDDDGPSADITTINARMLYDLRRGASVTQAAARKAKKDLSMDGRALDT